MSITETFTDILRRIDGSTVIYVFGVGILAVWLLRNSLAKTALADSKPRRNCMPKYLPFAVLIFWMAITILILAGAQKLLKGKSDGVVLLTNSLIQCAGSLGAIVLIVFLVRRTFARGLKGFGLNFRSLPRDIPYALLNLLAAWPIVTAVLVVTLWFGRQLYGSSYEIEPHQELQTVQQFSHSFLTIAIFISAAVITPVFEEMLFRGLFQTLIRSYITKPWPAILLSSILFAAVHVNMAHWPALFVLGVCMGYAYEKSGSLIRPMIIHAIFNGLSVIAVLLSS